MQPIKGESSSKLCGCSYGIELGDVGQSYFQSWSLKRGQERSNLQCISQGKARQSLIHLMFSFFPMSVRNFNASFVQLQVGLAMPCAREVV